MSVSISEVGHTLGRLLLNYATAVFDLRICRLSVFPRPYADDIVASTVLAILSFELMDHKKVYKILGAVSYDICGMNP